MAVRDVCAVCALAVCARGVSTCGSFQARCVRSRCATSNSTVARVPRLARRLMVNICIYTCVYINLDTLVRLATHACTCMYICRTHDIAATHAHCTRGCMSRMGKQWDVYATSHVAHHCTHVLLNARACNWRRHVPINSNTVLCNLTEYVRDRTNDHVYISQSVHSFPCGMWPVPITHAWLHMTLTNTHMHTFVYGMCMAVCTWNMRSFSS